MDHPRGQESFFERGLEYYISGRYAIFAGLTYVAGNLLHHAIEMLIKGYLLSYFGIDELRSQFRHDLKKLWGEFKSRSSSSLKEFDDVIIDLNKFEEIRYPDRALKTGLALSISPTQQTKAKSLGGSHSKVPQYDLTWEEIDKLVSIIFKVSSVNPKFFTGRYGEEARQFLLVNNSSPLI